MFLNPTHPPNIYRSERKCCWGLNQQGLAVSRHERMCLFPTFAAGSLMGPGFVSLSRASVYPFLNNIFLLRDLVTGMLQNKIVRNLAIMRKMRNYQRTCISYFLLLFQGIWVSTYVFTICFAANVGLLFGVVCTIAIVIGRFPR